MLIETATWEDKSSQAYRDYSNANSTVMELYHKNHVRQTVNHVIHMKDHYSQLKNGKMSVWRVLELLDTMIDESDPDTEMSQMMHALQSAEAARKDNQPRWMILTALIHDLGKYLSFLGEPQWTVVGDTFPVGCAYSDKIVYSEFFKFNPDYLHPVYSTQYGLYEPHCGLDKVLMSYGHDEYLYQVCKNYLPKEALYLIRFHSFYSCHKDKSYGWLMNEEDHAMMEWMNIFNQYDLYSKTENKPNAEALLPYYIDLVSEYFPVEIDW
ncbi:inositol oxygenase [Pilobolus umbonatus]|nr:inositol oxygenase [Pilobolus umbonatus]